MIVYTVSDSNENIATYLMKASARKEVITRLKEHAAEFSYSDEELIDAISELDGDFAAGHITCGTYLGEYEVFCTETQLIED